MKFCFYLWQRKFCEGVKWTELTQSNYFSFITTPRKPATGSYTD